MISFSGYLVETRFTILFEKYYDLKSFDFNSFNFDYFIKDFTSAVRNVQRVDITNLWWYKIRCV